MIYEGAEYSVITYLLLQVKKYEHIALQANVWKDV